MPHHLIKGVVREIEVMDDPVEIHGVDSTNVSIMVLEAFFKASSWRSFYVNSTKERYATLLVVHVMFPMSC